MPQLDLEECSKAHLPELHSFFLYIEAVVVNGYIAGVVFGVLFIIP